jgi:hypothetical protein
MDESVIYIIGPPAAGKSTLLQGLTAHLRWQDHQTPFAWQQHGPLAQLGARRACYPGTDALGMHVHPVVLAWLGTHPAPIILAEGDRLASAAFFRGVLARGYALTVIWLDLPWPDLWRRLQARGTRPSVAWVASRYTKCARLAAGWTLPRWRLDARRPAAAVVAAVAQHPALASTLYQGQTL